MMFCTAFFRVIALLLGSSVLTMASGAQAPVAQLQDRALAAELEQSRYWHSLIHYYPSRRSIGEMESHVDDARFFLAENGKFDPQAELLATIEALFAESTPIDNTGVRCHLVAREKWLRKQLDLPSVAVPEACTDYYSWRNIIGNGRVTLVFPASYLNSPSSMFGHTLLRFDPEDIETDSPLLSWSLNFAADVGGESMGAGYAFKGIAGGYPGKFNSIPYFEKLQEYGAIENRDIWEYELDLRPEEIDRMLDHAWELRDITFDYFFFRENCSFRLLELMDLARSGLDLADQFPLTAIPADTVKAVANAGIVSKIDYRPSLGTRLNHAIDATPADQRHWIGQIEASPELAKSAAFNALDLPTQARIIRTANELLTYRSRRHERNADTADRRLQLLTLVSHLPPETLEPIARPTRPETAHETTTVSLKLGRQADRNFTEASLRFSYHDLLDRNTGYAKGSGIVLGDLRVRKLADEDIRIEAFDIVKLQSFSDRFSQFKSLSWELTAGLEREPILEDDRLAARFDGSVGKSLRLGANDSLYALLGTSINQFVNPGSTHINGHVRFGYLGYHSLGASRIQFSADSFQALSLRTELSLRHNFPISTNQAIRVEAATQRFNSTSSNRYSLAYRFYF